MYKVRNKVYAEAGSLLIGKNKRGYVFIGELSEFSEEAIRIDDMKVEGNFLTYSNGRIKELYNPNLTYEQLKAKYVKRLFSNDDQIAIMLNKDSGEEADLIAYKKMQEWREWSSQVASKIMEIINH